MPEIVITVQPRPDHRLLLPAGLSTPHALCTGVTVHDVQGGAVPWASMEEAVTRQPAYVVSSGDAPIRVAYAYESGAMRYPDQMFVAHDSRYARPAGALATEMQAIAKGGDPAQAIANHVAQRFDYGHPDCRFYEDFDHIPQICGTTQGSCVDINAYLIAGLRSVGIAAGYVTGCFFPAEKTAADGSAWCEDVHCWVVTQDGHGERHWDIAHHLKIGAAEITPSLNPKPGRRFALAHSMGLSLPALGLYEIKLLAEPMWLVDGGLQTAELDIRLNP